MKKIAIITVSYNSSATIFRTITSVNKLLSVSNGMFKHYIIDGLSNDGTIDIIKKCMNSSTILISEPDSGIYDAMNKGLSLADTDYVWFLNSDDYIDDCFISSIGNFIDIINQSNYDYIVGCIKMFKSIDNRVVIKRIWKLPRLISNNFPFGWHPPHPAFIAKTSTIKLIGGFDVTKKISADFKLMLSVMKKSTNFLLYDRNFVMMQCGGESNGSITNIINANIECYNILREMSYGKLYSFFYVLKKINDKFIQQIRSFL